MKNIICITCPRGCHMSVDEDNGYAVAGNGCPRGVVYGRNELLNPVRMVTSTVRVEDGKVSRLPVKTDKPVPKSKIQECMALINGIVVEGSVEVGQILAANIMGTEANIVATKNLHLEGENALSEAI